MLVANHEENQQLAALAATIETTTIFSHFRMLYKLNMVLSYVWVDLRLKFLSIESQNTKKGLRTKKLWPSEVGGHNQKIQCPEPAGAYCFLSFSDIIKVIVALRYRWVDSRLKGLSIESNNSHNGILTKEL